MRNFIRRLVGGIFAGLGGLWIVWQILVSVVDWLSRFEWLTQQITNHEWVANVIEAIIAHPPPINVIVPICVFLTGIGILAFRRNPAVQTAVPEETPKGEPRRDVWLLNAIHYVAFGSWEITEWYGTPPDRVDEVLSGIYRATGAIRQWALDGELPIWGRPDHSSPLEKLPPEYWKHYGLKDVSILHGDPKELDTTKEAFSRFGMGVYRALMTSKTKIEELRNEGGIVPRSSIAPVFRPTIPAPRA